MSIIKKLAFTAAAATAAIAAYTLKGSKKAKPIAKKAETVVKQAKTKAKTVARKTKSKAKQIAKHA
jgi:hypothetical protein